MRKKAFTLIELLVVVALIALLVGLVVPPIHRARELTKRAVCQSRLKQIGMAIVAYTNDHKFYPFVGEAWTAEMMPVTPEMMLSKYLGDAWKTWQCPADTHEKRREDWFVWHIGSGAPAPWTEPADVLNVSYMWSEQLVRGFHHDYPSSDDPDDRCSPPWRPINSNTVAQADEWGMLSEGWHIFNGWTWETLGLDRDLDCRVDQTHPGGEYRSVNVLFGDGHVRLRECIEAKMKEIRSAPYGPEP